jgi:Phosphotransferase enzyme family
MSGFAPYGPPAGTARRAWTALPASVRAAIAVLLGAEVVDATTQTGGFSPGVAARVRLADGSRAFVKAVCDEWNPDSPGMFRREATVAAVLPESAPAPRFLGQVEEDGFVVLAFECIDGRQPAIPWRPEELRAVLAAVADMAGALTPSPVAIGSLADVHADTFSGFAELSEMSESERRAKLDPWVGRHLSRLAAMEAGWTAAGEGQSLIHVDLRADNMLITADSQVFLVDWPHAAVGAAWVDLVCLLPSVAMQGGPEPQELFVDQPLAREADPDAVTTMICALAGMFLGNGLHPDSPGIPGLRRFQLAQAEVALRWLRQRTGWE